jgi:hypothetical protein
VLTGRYFPLHHRHRGQQRSPEPIATRRSTRGWLGRHAINTDRTNGISPNAPWQSPSPRWTISRTDPAHAIDEEHPRRCKRLAWDHRPPVCGSKLDIKDGGIVGTRLYVVKRQLGPVIHLPWIKSDL